MSLRQYSKANVLLVITLATIPLTAFSLPHKEKQFGLHAPFQIADLPAGHVRSKLDALPETRKQKALKRLHGFSFTEHDLEYLHVDNEGGVLYSDTFLPDEGTATTLSTIELPQAISAIDAFTLHSKPGATKVVYLDFDGHVLTGTAWNAYTGNATLNAKAYDTDGNLGAFSPTELSQIAEIWHRVAEDYAPFNVDVTTQLPVSFSSTVGRILITQDIDANGNNMPSYGAGGVAYVNVWGASNYASYYSPALVYYNKLGPGHPPYIAEAASHEMGHNLGLSHDGFNDGTTSLGYYRGQGTGFVSWAPIMGVGYFNNVTQWSKGEYSFATQTEDDINLISTKLTYRTDDHGNNALSSTSLSVDATGTITASNPETDPHNTNGSNKGIVETRSDVDYFSFDAGAGAININVTPAWEAFYRPSTRGANLDIQATLYDQNGVQVAQNDPLTETDAVISVTIPAGHYYLGISGVGVGNSLTAGYTDYGSLGEYFISGTVIPGTIIDSTPPTPNPMTFAAAPNAGTSTNSIAMTASAATDNSGVAVQYHFVCVAGGAGCVDGGWQASNQYTATGLNAGVSYTYKVQARDNSGNQTDFSATVSATTVLPLDSTPPTPNPMTFAVAPNAGTSTNSIAMTAVTATDNSGVAVQYHFVCTTGGAGCVDGGWQASNQYTATGLDAGKSYTYKVQARDNSGNQTSFSSTVSATTASPLPSTPANLTYSKGTTQVVLGWNISTYAASYEIWRCNEVKKGFVTSCNYGTTRYATSGLNSFTDATKTGFVRYKVKAVNATGVSGFSNEVRL